MSRPCSCPWPVHDRGQDEDSVGRHDKVVGMDTQNGISSRMTLVSFLDFLEYLLNAFPECQTPGKCDANADMKMLAIFRLDTIRTRLEGFFVSYRS